MEHLRLTTAQARWNLLNILYQANPLPRPSKTPTSIPSYEAVGTWLGGVAAAPLLDELGTIRTLNRLLETNRANFQWLLDRMSQRLDSDLDIQGSIFSLILRLHPCQFLHRQHRLPP